MNRAGPCLDLDAYRDHLVVACRQDGLPQVMILRLGDNDVHYISGIEEEDFAMSPRGGREFDTTSLRFSYTSMKTPAAVYDYDMDARERVLRKQQEIPSGYDADRYDTRRIWATARDGTSVPISLLMLKGHTRGRLRAAVSVRLRELRPDHGGQLRHHCP